MVIRAHSWASTLTTRASENHWSTCWHTSGPALTRAWNKMLQLTWQPVKCCRSMLSAFVTASFVAIVLGKPAVPIGWFRWHPRRKTLPIMLSVSSADPAHLKLPSTSQFMDCIIRKIRHFWSIASASGVVGGRCLDYYILCLSSSAILLVWTRRDQYLVDWHLTCKKLVWHEITSLEYVVEIEVLDPPSTPWTTTEPQSFSVYESK